MAVLIDTGILIAIYSPPDQNYRRAVELVDEVMDGVHGQAYLTDYVLAEVLNYVVAKSRIDRKADSIAKDLLGESGEPWLEFKWIDEETWRHGRERFRAYSRARLSFTDCTSLAFIERNRLDAMVSFDSGFDGIVPRIH
ncbi:MAG TPA: PIN domain-containing protein [Candidatus Thermoplasmatota archaeon]